MLGERFLAATTSATAPEQQQRALAGFGLLQVYDGLRSGVRRTGDPLPGVAETRALLDGVTPSLASDTALRAVLDALAFWDATDLPHFGRRVVYTALLKYGDALIGDSMSAPASDVLEIVAVDSEVEDELEISAQARLLSGFAYRLNGDWEASVAAYDRSYRLAMTAGDRFTAIRARIGQANNRRSRGDMPGAEAILRPLVVHARRYCPEALPRVFLAQATLLNAMSRYEEALTQAYKALAAAKGDDDARTAALVDIAHFLSDFGAEDVARDALTAVLAGTPPDRIRVHAQLNLLFIAATHGDQPSFDELRAALRNATLSVRQQAQYHLFCAQGLRVTGRSAEAREECEMALATAQTHSLFQLVFQAEEELRNIDSGTGERTSVPMAAPAALPAALPAAPRREPVVVTRIRRILAESEARV